LRLLAAVERIEKRIQDLEQTTKPALGFQRLAPKQPTEREIEAPGGHPETAAHPAGHGDEPKV
jgi:hypothetical protein